MITLPRPYKIKYLIYFLSLLASRQLAAQNNTSPYSILGIGDIEESAFDRTSGMANTGLAYRSPSYLIQGNPASYTALQDQFFNFELAARGRFVTYNQSLAAGNSSVSGQGFSIEKMGMGIKVKKWWGSGLGITPFSTSSYYFTGQKSIEGSTSPVYHIYEGNGGVHKVFWSNGFQLTKNFSVGITSSILFGSLTQSDSTLAADQTTSLLTTTQNIYLRNFYFSYGFQYYGKIGKKWDVGVGGVFADKSHLLAEHSITITDQNGTALRDDITKNDYFYLPRSYGIGLRLTKNKKYTFLADYKYQDWGSLNDKGEGYALTDSWRYSAGFELSKTRPVLGTHVEALYMQAGAYYGNSYLNVFSQQLRDYGITLGIGANAKRSGLGYGLSLQVGNRGTTNNGLVRETYTNFTFTVSYRDFWFTKGKKFF